MLFHDPPSARVTDDDVEVCATAGADEDMDGGTQAPEAEERPLLTVECHARAIHSATSPAFQADCSGSNGAL